MDDDDGATVDNKGGVATSSAATVGVVGSRCWERGEGCVVRNVGAKKKRSTRMATTVPISSAMPLRISFRLALPPDDDDDDDAEAPFRMCCVR